MSITVLSPDLATLASNAAVELDLLIQGETVEANSVLELGKRLKETLTGDASQTKRLHVDTASETILGRAFAETGSDPKNILAELFERTEKAAKDLASSASSGKESLEWLRAFCLALSQSASAYRQLSYNMRPPHPYRR